MEWHSNVSAATDAVWPLGTPSPPFTLSIASPPATPVTENLANSPAVASQLPSTRSTGSWSDKGDLFANSSTTGYICAACHRVLEPVRALLTQFNASKLHVGASVVDLAVQHPLPYLRVKLVRLLLTFRRWNWSMCAPVAVAASVGDVDVLASLLSVEELEPNLGFPLRVAVQCHRNDQVLPFLVSHHRINPNYGGAFYVAVAIGNTEAMHILGAAAQVNVNRFTNGEGTSALLYALRQLLVCSAIAAAAPQSSSTTASAPLHSRKPQRGITSSSSPLSSTAEEKVVTASSLFAGEVGDGVNAHAKHQPLRLLSGNADSSGVAFSADATASGGTPFPPVSSNMIGPLWQRDRPHFRNVSPVVTMDVEHDDITLPAHGEDRDETHSIALQQDTVAHPLLTAQHWRAVLLYLLDHPAIQVNIGFYITPLQMAVFAGNVEVVSLLLQHPHLRPNCLPKPASVLCASYSLLQRQTLSKDALRCVVATPVEMAVQLHQLEIFKLLVRDPRVRLPMQLTMNLERLAWDAEAIPYLTIIAQHRVDWEGWGWRWRRLCVLIATAANCVIALCSWAVWCAWYDSLRPCGVGLLCTYGVQVIMGIFLVAWEAYVTQTASSAVQQPAPVLVAFVQHLVPLWPSAWQCGFSAVLLLCPGMVPLLDLLCAWILYKTHRDRRPLQTAAHPGGAEPEVPPQHRPADLADSSTNCARLPSVSRERIDGAWRQSVWLPTPHGWPSMSVVSSVSGHDSFKDVPCLASFSYKESFSRLRTAMARTRQQVVTDGGDQRVLHAVGVAPASAAAESAVSTSAHPMTTSTVGHASVLDGEFASQRTSSIMTNSIIAPSPVGHRSPWVVPGRPSRFAAPTEYHTPDLTLRALAYVTYDWLLVAPRLLLSAVAILMFLYMLFPSSLSTLPSPSTTMVRKTPTAKADEAIPPPFTTAARDGTTTHSISALQYYDRLLSATLTEAAAIAVETNPTDLAHLTTMMILVGLCGLVASIVSGSVLLAMVTSLRTITTKSCFANSGDRDNAGSRSGRNGHVLRHGERNTPRRAVAKCTDSMRQT
ncbi:hypothetical protein Q4I28_004460 [Leishmania naiffi]|uniref:Transmembrane protein n=1 Tax=Leishmania naiffi TaxID=5678 RepID=A0AAW3BKF0_9TRYP